MKQILSAIYFISIFKNIIKDEVISSYINFLKTAEEDTKFDEIIEKYSIFIDNLYTKTTNYNLFEYTKKLIETDENILSKNRINKSTQIIDTAEFELSIIHNLISTSHDEIKENLKNKFSQMNELIEHLPFYSIDGIQKFSIQEIIKSYNEKGYGIFATFYAFKLTKDGEIEPIEYVDKITFSDLKNYEYQQNIIKQNTKAFLEGKTANNILLYGDRGCGKSSTVKALLNEFKQDNLKIIQIYKESFTQLHKIFNIIRNLPNKFIIFADDLSFNEDDREFSSVKAVIEGSLTNCPENAIIYATTNRLHLVKESFSSREGSEVHYNDTIDETVSLSDRFGITLTFSSLNKNEYLDIMHQIAVDNKLTISDEMDKEAMAFSIQKGIMTPRIAKQFINYYISNCKVL